MPSVFRWRKSASKLPGFISQANRRKMLNSNFNVGTMLNGDAALRMETVDNLPIKGLSHWEILYKDHLYTKEL